MTRLFLLCCLLVLMPIRAAGSVALDGLRFMEVRGAFADCGRVPGPAGEPFVFAQLRARQFHCLRAEFTVARQPALPQRLLLSMLAASEIYLDGVRVGVNGVPSDNAEGERQGLIDYGVQLAPEQLAAGRHELVLKLSTWHGSDRIREQFYQVAISDSPPGATGSLLPFFLAGALALVALLFLVLLACYQRTMRWAVFGALCAVASLLLVVEAWRGAAGYVYGHHLARLLAVQLLTAVFGLLLPLYFLVAYQLRGKALAMSLLALLMAGLAFSGMHFDAIAALMFSVALVASLGINLLAWRRRMDGSRGGLAVSLAALALWLVPGTGFFSEAGFALVVFLLLLAILGQLLRQLILERKKAMLASALEIQLLRKSLQPHFLMNSLSLVGELVHHSPAQAEQFIEALGREFRMLGEYASHATIPLVRELELCHNYLTIMGVRLQRRCVLNVRGEPGTLCLPPAVLLTCLENAFSHNRYRHDLTFDISIERGQGDATLELAMPLADGRKHQGSGTGESYILGSLREAFAGMASFQCGQRDGFWRAIIKVPS